MKLKISTITFIIISAFTLKVNSQSNLFFLTIKGNWTEKDDTTRARFEGNNNLILNHIKSVSFPLITGPNINEIAEITFTVTDQGEVENINLTNSLGSFYDNTFELILQSMSGKWFPAKRDNKYISEDLTIWINIYNGPNKGKSKTEYIKIGKKLYDENNYKKAIKYFNKVLDYDKLNIEIMKLKGNALLKLNMIDEACDIWKTISKYNPEEVKGLLIQNCNN